MVVGAQKSSKFQSLFKISEYILKNLWLNKVSSTWEFNDDIFKPMHTLIELFYPIFRNSENFHLAPEWTFDDVNTIHTAFFFITSMTLSLLFTSIHNVFSILYQYTSSICVFHLYFRSIWWAQCNCLQKSFDAFVAPLIGILKMTKIRYLIM